MSNLQNQKGIAVFIAIIAVSAILLIVLSIADIAFKEQILTYSGKDSKIAFYAADSGLECALYHDVKKPGFSFATPNDPLQVGIINCDGLPVNNPAITSGDPTTQTIYSYNLSGTANSCTIVIVSKTDTGSPPIKTKIEASGYNNNCNTTAN